MSSNSLAIYLHDHLAGSGGALTLIDDLLECGLEDRFADTLGELKREITWERSQLEALAARFPVPTSLPRRFAGWAAEKGLGAKLLLDGRGELSFRLLESLEALSIGIAGKRLLWRILSRQAKVDDALVGPNYHQLIVMAASQRRRLEPRRLEAARMAFGFGLARLHLAPRDVAKER